MRGVFETPHDRPPTYGLMITVYLDESRHTDPNSYMVLAGFLGNKEQWESFAPQWIVGLGNRRCLHMRTLRLNSRAEQRRGRVKKLLGKLGPLPYAHGLRPIYSAVRTGDYLDIVANSRHEKILPGYAICLAAVISRLGKIVPMQESIKIVCEINPLYEDAANTMFRQVTIALSRPDRPYFSGIEFIPKNSSILTQPSDFLAFAIAHYHENRQSYKTLVCTPIFGPSGISAIHGMTLPSKVIRGIVARTKNHAQRWERR